MYFLNLFPPIVSSFERPQALSQHTGTATLLPSALYRAVSDAPGISVHPSGEALQAFALQRRQRPTLFWEPMMHFASDTYWFPTPFSSPLHNVPTTR